MELSYAHLKVLRAIITLKGKPSTMVGIGEVAGLTDWTAKKSIQELRDAGYIEIVQSRRNAPGVWSVIREWRL